MIKILSDSEIETIFQDLNNIGYCPFCNQQYLSDLPPVFVLDNFVVYCIDNQFIIFPDKHISEIWDLSEKDKDTIDKIIWQIKHAFESQFGKVLWEFKIQTTLPFNHVVCKLIPIIKTDKQFDYTPCDLARRS